jgi:hypothetical protein
MSVLAKSFSAVLLALPFSLSAFSDPPPPELTYRPLPIFFCAMILLAVACDLAMARSVPLPRPRPETSQPSACRLRLTSDRAIASFIAADHRTR